MPPGVTGGFIYLREGEGLLFTWWPWWGCIMIKIMSIFIYKQPFSMQCNWDTCAAFRHPAVYMHKQLW